MTQIVYAVTAWDHHDHRSKVVTLHATRTGAYDGLREGVRGEVSNWPEGFHIEEHLRGGQFEADVVDSTYPDYAITTWEVVPYELLP